MSKRSVYDSMSLPQCMAFVFKERGGEPSVRAVMEGLTKGDNTPKEMGLDIIDELRLVGLDVVAEIMAAYVDKWPSEFDEPCPYGGDDIAGRVDWKRRMDKKRAQWEAKRSALVGGPAAEGPVSWAWRKQKSPRNETWGS